MKSLVTYSIALECRLARKEYPKTTLYENSSLRIQ